MGKSLYTLALVLMLAWLVDLLVIGTGGWLHVLPVIALIILYAKLIRQITVDAFKNYHSQQIN